MSLKTFQGNRYTCCLTLTSPMPQKRIQNFIPILNSFLYLYTERRLCCYRSGIKLIAESLFNIGRLSSLFIMKTFYQEKIYSWYEKIFVGFILFILENGQIWNFSFMKTQMYFLDFTHGSWLKVSIYIIFKNWVMDV